MTIKAFALSAAAAALTATSSFGAGVTLNVVGGELLGASNVDVNGTLFDVEFVDGTCAAIFDGCDSVSDFDFPTRDLATAAATSLGDSVFIDGPLGNFGSDPTLTVGIDSIAQFRRATILVPYRFSSTPGIERFEGRSFLNFEGRPDVLTFSSVPLSFDLSDLEDWTFARFTPSQIAAVPLPAGGFLLLAALAGYGALAARRKRSATR